MQNFNQAAVDDGDAPALRLGLAPGVDNKPGGGDGGGVRPEHGVGGGDLFGMNKGFAIETQRPALLAGLPVAVVIVQVPQRLPILVERTTTESQ